MSKADAKNPVDERRAESDFNGGLRGQDAPRHAEGSNVVVLDPDVAERFRTSKDVNRALRRLADKEASDLTTERHAVTSHTLSARTTGGHEWPHPASLASTLGRT